MLAAGSLNDALENGLRPALDRSLRVEARGSAEISHLVAEGTRDPDLVSLADVSLIDARLDTDWYTEFASNAIVLAYDSRQPGGRRIADAAPSSWYRPLLDDEISIGRTDPDLDPLGYRTLMTLELATDHHDTDVDLREAIPTREQVYPETQLLGQFETGGLDAVFAYRNMADSRGYDYVELPTAIDLSDPAQADRYASTSYELPDGTVVDGDVIRYGATIRTDSAAAREVFRRHVTGSYLESFGFVVPETHPQYEGDVPASIRD
jgi:molybdate/tungstate transport system substrate-binding protein